MNFLSRLSVLLFLILLVTQEGRAKETKIRISDHSFNLRKLDSYKGRMVLSKIAVLPVGSVLIYKEIDKRSKYPMLTDQKRLVKSSRAWLRKITLIKVPNMSAAKVKQLNYQTLYMSAPNRNSGSSNSLPGTNPTKASSNVFSKIDKSKQMNRLVAKRAENNIIDQCFEDKINEKFSASRNKKMNSFSSIIRGAIRMGLLKRTIEARYYTNSYKVKKNNKTKVSLVSQRYCSYTKSEMKHSLHLEKNFATEETRKNIQKFYKALNSNNASNRMQRKNLVNIHSAFFGCLAYTESLGVKDTTESDKIFAQSRDEGLVTAAKRPAGVFMHMDHPGGWYNHYFAKRKSLKKQGITENAYSIAVAYANKKVPKTWKTVGLFQFTASRTSNVNPCIKQWNKEFSNRKSCQIGRSEKAQLRALSTPRQAFNAYCGVQKVLQQFDVQVNTMRQRYSALANRDGDSLVKGQNRCVNHFVRAGKKGFVHFGPMANSVPDAGKGVGNLGILMKCTVNALGL